jgi:transposase InsO family protein
VRSLLKQLKTLTSVGPIRCCYEAGPTGFALRRALQKEGGDLTEVYVADETTEAMRDVERAREHAKRAQGTHGASCGSFRFATDAGRREFVMSAVAYLAANGEVRERQNVLRHMNHPRPELLATKPNELWSWDMTKLKGPGKWTYFYLYVVLDVFSRYVVGWMVATEESATLAKRLVAETCRREGIEPSQLTLHDDRGSAMTSKSFALLLADLGVMKMHSRPHVSNDQPVLGVGLQDSQVPPRLPRPLRLRPPPSLATRRRAPQDNFNKFSEGLRLSIPRSS